jgi:hypothetical protein
VAQEFLTAEQGVLLGELAAGWRPRALRVGPADRMEAEAAARALLVAMGKGAPGSFVWVASPLQGAIAASRIGARLVAHRGIAFNDRFLGYEVYQIWKQVWGKELRGRGFDVIEMLGVSSRLDDLCSPHLGSDGHWFNLRIAHCQAVREDSASQVDAADDHSSMGWFGPLEPHLLSKIELFRKLGIGLGPLEPLLALGAHCGMAWLMKDVCVLCEYPVSIERGEVGGVPGAFTRVRYADGFDVTVGAD